MVVIGIPFAALRVGLARDIAQRVVAVADGGAVGVCDGEGRAGRIVGKRRCAAQRVRHLRYAPERVVGIRNFSAARQRRFYRAAGRVALIGDRAPRAVRYAQLAAKGIDFLLTAIEPPDGNSE